MKCPECGKELVFKPGRHHYRESGLENIFLDGVEMADCACGERIVSLPAVPDLHKMICESLIRKPWLLTGNELRFLRKNMGFSATRLAKAIGVTKETVSKWENAKRDLTPPMDRLARLLYANTAGIPANEIKGLLEGFASISPRHGGEPMAIPSTSWLPGEKKGCALGA